jgi:hypothetical protein
MHSWLSLSRIDDQDIECAGRPGSFPDPGHDPIIQIANYVTIQGTLCDSFISSFLDEILWARCFSFNFTFTDLVHHHILFPFSLFPSYSLDRR